MYIHILHMHPPRVDTGLAPGRKKAYLLYKAALKEAAANAKLAAESESEDVSPRVVTPHPYTLALGVISIQKVGMLEIGSLSCLASM